MISVVYCTRESNPEHKKHLIKTSGLHKSLEVIEIINTGESLTKCYNRGLKQAKNDIIVFLHDDITFDKGGWGKRLIKHYESTDYGILGVAGTKFLSETGRWWDKRQKMYGRVKHTSGGKSWLSKYSPDINNDIEEVIVVDGVFFSVHRGRLKNNFDESVEGFHFYDVDFCFQNYLAGVKIGVHTNVKVNHQSIGETNDQWEENRVLFAEKNKELLPVNIKKTFREGQPIKVLIGCLYFQNFTGSEMHVYELAKELIKQGCDVSVCSSIGEPMISKAKKAGIKLFPMDEPPSYKKGDGQWSIPSPNGPITSEIGKLYKISIDEFDVLHLMHKPVTEHLMRFYPETNILSTIHSEVIDLEHPVINTKIKKYIAIRPEIKEFLKEDFNINGEMIDIIYNPIDYTRFKEVTTTNNRDFKRVIFVGTIDYLRKQTIQDLINTTGDEGNELWIVGNKNDSYLDDMIQGKEHVKYFEPTWNVEKLVKECDETAGILLGRTTIEGWLCGKKGWIYDVDSSGNIKSKVLHDIPEDIDKFRSDSVAKKIIEKYKEIVD